jgi:hypothetical protein
MNFNPEDIQVQYFLDHKNTFFPQALQEAPAPYGPVHLMCELNLDNHEL